MSPRARACSRIVRALVKERGVGVLWATHLVDEVAGDDQVVLLHKGRVRFSGGVPNLLEAAQADNHAQRVHARHRKARAEAA